MINADASRCAPIIVEADGPPSAPSLSQSMLAYMSDVDLLLPNRKSAALEGCRYFGFTPGFPILESDDWERRVAHSRLTLAESALEGLFKC